MSQSKKLLEKVRNNPKNVSFDDLARLLMLYGFEQRKQSSGTSHFFFYKEGCEPLSVPKHKPVKSVYVRRVLRLIQACGDPEEE